MSMHGTSAYLAALARYREAHEEAIEARRKYLGAQQRSADADRDKERAWAGMDASERAHVIALVKEDGW